MKMMAVVKTVFVIVMAMMIRVHYDTGGMVVVVVMAVIMVVVVVV